MNKKILFLLIISWILVFSKGCKKDDSQNSPVTIQVNMKVNQTFQYNLRYFGDEEGAIMVRQGSHFQTSKLERLDYEKIKYTYIPLPDYTGTDEIELRAGRGLDGANPNTNIISYIFKIRISD
jgi:hypothetical protein